MKIKLLFNWHFWYDLKYKVKCFFKPRQEWLTDVIPDTYCDKVELIPRMLFKCLVHYVEVERQADHLFPLDHDYTEDVREGRISPIEVDVNQKVDRDILKAYKWIVDGRPKLEEKIDNTYPSVDIDSMIVKREDGHFDMNIPDDVKACYSKINKLEALKIKKDTEAMRLIVKHHQSLWT